MVLRAQGYNYYFQINARPHCDDMTCPPTRIWTTDNTVNSVGPCGWPSGPPSLLCFPLPPFQDVLVQHTGYLMIFRVALRLSVLMCASAAPLQIYYPSTTGADGSRIYR